MAANAQMHTGMAINFSCHHSVDFVRGMIPHHSGAIVMCEIVAQTVPPDPFITELCVNITRLQRAEITWLSEWLVNRGHGLLAPCEHCAAPKQPAVPCEDTLSTSSFCHLLGGDLNCDCPTAVAQYPCGTVAEIQGFGNFDTSAQCRRTCGGCPGERAPLFPSLCPKDDMNMSNGMDMTCGDVKAAYKASNCCGNPTAAFSLPSRRMTALSNEEDDELLIDIRTALEHAKAQSSFHLESLSKQLLSIVNEGDLNA